MLSKFGGGGDKKIEKKWVLGEKLESMNYKGQRLFTTLSSLSSLMPSFLTVVDLNCQGGVCGLCSIPVMTPEIQVM